MCVLKKNNNAYKYKILRKKPPPYQRGGDFIDGHF